MQDPLPISKELLKKFEQSSKNEVFLKDFYRDWYFYQEYKNKEHYPNSFKIRYV